MDGGDRRRIRVVLFEDFGSVCAYCERSCEWPNSYRNSPNQETIDHFRPRSRFPGLWLDWLNLVYSCHRCNQTKSGSWPEHYDDINQKLAAREPGYTPVSEYVSPNEEPGQRSASEFFAFDVETGEMTAGEHLDGEEWSIAHRTIGDIDLNDELSERETYDPDHLFNQRRYHLYLLIEQINTHPDLSYQVMQEATLPDKPFS